MRYLLLLFMLVVAFCFIGCAALKAGMDPEVQKQIADLQAKAVLIDQQYQEAYALAKTNGFTPETIDKLFALSQSSTDIYRQISDVRDTAKEKGLSWWETLAMTLVAGLVGGTGGYPIMRKARKVYEVYRTIAHTQGSNPTLGSITKGT